MTPERLDRVLSCAVHRRSGGPDEQPFSLPLACAALVGALFRQVTTVGTVGDPVTEGLEALALDDHQVPLVAWIEGLARAERAELEAEVERRPGPVHAVAPARSRLVTADPVFACGPRYAAPSS